MRTGSLLAAIAVATACTTGSGDVRQAADTATPASGQEQSTRSPTDPFTIAFGGDVMFEGILRARLDDDPGTALGPIADTLSAADLAMVNLETAVTHGGTPVPGKQFVFRAPPAAFEALDAAGIDVVSIANNHGMDYGEEGLLDTLRYAEEADFPVVGAGRDIDAAYAPHITEVNGSTVAIIGATDVLDEELIPTWTAGEGRPGLASAKYEMRETLIAAVRSASEDTGADTVVVFLHWGLEGSHCPLPHAPDLARDLIGAGADVVVGAHAHVLAPGGYLGDAYVHYGLGNFAFYNFSGPTAESGVLTLTLHDGAVLDDEWLPARIEGGVPIPYEGDSADRARAEWERLRTGCATDLAAVPSDPAAGAPGEGSARPTR
ncbi:poly-gamma-glutamate synthesis protein (capsule biosynthesis protein) [Nocardiopsis mwathae]|uniref:Poly-gamma-glutamate synthesis protein (Capsule biosynthesis protein) n=1 Tax=Nocardiopsis mwathae TaxID=1472723 RepID=A0A7W9YL20_9ACTN|nr:CapA family protein [Nocardiopsis mwathae]MBB6174132.1 poly-gamma-glutamate synthesis protein (capsule biosynthesis protein) [Nocardiopsis mwathae]